jgi:arylsulfatase A-like enzyme
VFRNAWSQADITSMSHASLFTSRYPSELGHAGPTFRLDGTAPTLAQVLGLYGYASAAFTAGGHLAPGAGIDRGFQTWEASPPMGSFWHTAPAAERWLDQRHDESPFLLFVHSYDVHAPYLAPAPFSLAWADRGYTGPAAGALESRMGSELVYDHLLFGESVVSRIHSALSPRLWDPEARRTIASWAADSELGAVPFSAADGRHLADAYDGGVAYADAMFGRFVADLKARGLYDRLVIVVLSDHGEELGEEGRFGHGESLGDESLHVPLIVRLPGGAPMRVEAQVSLLDVLPTLLELAGASAPATAEGRSLVPWLRGRSGRDEATVYAEGNGRMISARSAAGRLTFSGISPNSRFLDGLLGVADLAGPAFAQDTTAPAAARETLRNSMVSWRSNLTPAGLDAPAADPNLVEQMRAQGYWAPR